MAAEPSRSGAVSVAGCSEGAKARAMGDSDSERHRVRNVVSRLEEAAGGDRVPLGDLVQACGVASFVPALLVPALLVVSPLSGVPLFSSVCGITIVLISAQMLWRRDHLSLPGFVTRRTVDGDKLRGAFERLHRIAAFLDRNTRVDRFHQLVGRGGSVVPQALCVAAGALMPVLEIVPFSSSVLGTAVLCFAVGLLTRDGLFVVFGIAIMAVLGIAAYFVVT